MEAKSVIKETEEKIAAQIELKREELVISNKKVDNRSQIEKEYYKA